MGRRQVFLAAQAEYLRWLDAEAPKVLADLPDREAFNRLLKAATDLDVALRAFPHASSNAALLVGLMQQAEGNQQPQRGYRDLLGRLAEDLGLLRHAAARIAGRGATANLHARAWVWSAARSWRATMLTAPSAAEGGAFWVALDEFQNSQAKAVQVPALSRKAVVSALKLWPGHDKGAGVPEPA